MIYIDAGFWQGRALEIYRDIGLVNKNWKIFAFEPNITLDVEEDVERIGLPLKMSRAAVWTKDERVNFRVEGRPDAARIIPKSEKGDYSLRGMDFSRFVADLPDEFILCNMDIEGAEFPVLRKMLEDGSIEKIKILEIEFHHRLVENYEKVDAEQLIEDLVRAGVKVILKVPL